MKALFRSLSRLLRGLAHGLVGRVEPLEPCAGGTLPEETGERATWRAVQLVPSKTGADPRQRKTLSQDPVSGLEAFDPLEPISAAEIAATDLDQLARRLTDSS